MLEKLEILKAFHNLSRFLDKEGKIESIDWYKENFPAFLSFAGHLKAYQIAAPLCRMKRVLDLGCFLGYGAELIAGSAEKVIAVDRDEKALAWAAKTVNHPRVSFKKAKANELPFPASKFDVVIAFELIEHLPPGEVVFFLKEAKRVLKANGKFFLSTPNRSFRLLPCQRPFNPEHHREYGREEFCAILRKTFSDVCMKGIRASTWIEEIEKKRVRQSPCFVYVRAPVVWAVKKVFPGIEKRISLARRERSITEKAVKSEPGSFRRLFEKFSLDDFYVEERNPEKAITLLALCRKD